MRDVYRASSSVENILMIFPIGIITIILFVIAVSVLVRKITKHNLTKDGAVQVFGRKELKIVISMTIYFLYSIAIIYIGFDIGTFLFIVAMLLLQGERSILKLILFPFIFSVLVSFFFSLMIPYPMPMFLNFEAINIF